MKEIARDEYLGFFKSQTLTVFSSFTDVEGNALFGYGVPAMDTEWGNESISDDFIVRSEARKDYSHETEWRYTYYKNENC